MSTSPSAPPPPPECSHRDPTADRLAVVLVLVLVLAVKDNSLVRGAK
ncbi:hypothetical protein [Streptomyces clavifer]